MSTRRFRPAQAFTLLELMVSVAIIALLIGVLLPALAGARESGRRTVCLSNQRQLMAALHLYAQDHDDSAPPGASDFRANLSRWHGTRSRTSDPFATPGGAMTPYISGASRALRTCPSFAGVMRRLDDASLGFERSAGGYGYNNAYLGVRLERVGDGAFGVQDDRSGSPMWRFFSPDAAVAFADAAFPDGRAPDRLIEYSFVEPRFFPQYGEGPNGFRPDPSIHFRHGIRDGAAQACVAWLDGRADIQPMTHSHSSGLYNPPASDVDIGWFGAQDTNALFDYDAGGR